MTLEPYGRYWAVHDEMGELVCLCVYKKGAREVIRRLSGKEANTRKREVGMVAERKETRR